MKLGDVNLRRVGSWRVGSRGTAGIAALTVVDRARGQRSRQVVLAHQRVVLVRRAAHRWSPPAPAPVPDGTAADLQRRLEMRQQGRGIRAVPAAPVRGRRPRRRRIRHQGFVPQQVLVQIPELPPLTVRVAAVRCIDRASGLFRHASRITNRNDAPDVDTSRSSTVTVSKRTSTSRSRRASTGTR